MIRVITLILALMFIAGPAQAQDGLAPQGSPAFESVLVGSEAHFYRHRTFVSLLGAQVRLNSSSGAGVLVGMELGYNFAHNAAQFPSHLCPHFEMGGAYHFHSQWDMTLSFYLQTFWSTRYMSLGVISRITHETRWEGLHVGFIAGYSLFESPILGGSLKWEFR